MIAQKAEREAPDASREAAKECSPRRKPWVGCGQPNKAPKGRKKRNLIPDVLLVVLQLILLQKRYKLLPK